MTYPRYNTSATLVGTMFEFGRYTLSYQPPEGAVEAAVEMSISSEADLSQMMRFFESFLQAAGYGLDDRELSLERKAPEFDPPRPSQQWAGYPASSFSENAINFGVK
jgi:hypothetical protein